MMAPKMRCCGLLAFFMIHSPGNDARSSQSILDGKPISNLNTKC